jgi:plasmid maintenance system antidote protein VapI
MTDEVRAAVNAYLQERGMSRADLARAVERTPQEITRALNGGKNGGSVSPLWIAIFQALKLELTVREQQDSDSAS